MSNNSKMVQDGASYNGGSIKSRAWSIEPRKVVHGLSNRAILNDLERPQTQISRSDHSLMLNTMWMVNDKKGKEQEQKQP